MLKATTIDRRQSLYREALRVMERHFAADLDLDEVARMVLTSRRQLQRAFAEAGDTSFRTELARIRMRRAVELLRQSSLPVNEIARSVGYRQPGQFTKAFRRHQGEPPSSFRRTETLAA